MTNLIDNAAGLDGVTSWSASAGATRAIDWSDLGGPGRAAIVASKALSIGQTVALWSDVAAVTSGEALDVAAGVANSDGGAIVLQVEIVDGGGARIGLVNIPTSAPAYAGGPRRGLAETYRAARTRFASPATGFARLLATSTAAGAGTHRLALLKPLLARPVGRWPARFDPGEHVNIDLQLPAWPSILPAFRRDLQGRPYPSLAAFAGDAGIPANASINGGDDATLTGRMSLNPIEADALDQFYRQTRTGVFYIVRPDTDQLCMAEWLAEGAPALAGYSGINVVMEVGLHIWIA